MTRLAATEIEELDPYKFMATIGKRRVAVDEADILTLPYPDSCFDVVVAEAVTMRPPGLVTRVSSRAARSRSTNTILISGTVAA